MQDYINYLSQSKFYYPGNDLGLTYSKKASTFKVWSPIAKSISLVLYKDAGVYDSEGKVKDHSDYIKEYPMEYNQQGIWSIKIKADLENKYYMYKYIKSPGVLIEAGFISNPNENYLLRKEEYQNKLVTLIEEGVEIYFENR